MRGLALSFCLMVTLGSTLTSAFLGTRMRLAPRRILPSVSSVLKQCSQPNRTRPPCEPQHKIGRNGCCRPCKCHKGKGKPLDSRDLCMEKCHPCILHETFNDHFSFFCKPCRNCGPDEVVIQRCNVFSDTICRRVYTPGSENRSKVTTEHRIVYRRNSLPTAAFSTADSTTLPGGIDKGPGDINFSVSKNGPDASGNSAVVAASVVAVIAVMVVISLIVGTLVIARKQKRSQRYKIPVCDDLGSPGECENVPGRCEAIESKNHPTFIRYDFFSSNEGANSNMQNECMNEPEPVHCIPDEATDQTQNIESSCPVLVHITRNIEQTDLRPSNECRAQPRPNIPTTCNPMDTRWKTPDEVIDQKQNRTPSCPTYGYITQNLEQRQLPVRGPSVPLMSTGGSAGRLDLAKCERIPKALKDSLKCYEFIDAMEIWGNKLRVHVCLNMSEERTSNEIQQLVADLAEARGNIDRADCEVVFAENPITFTFYTFPPLPGAKLHQKSRPEKHMTLGAYATIEGGNGIFILSSGHGVKHEETNTVTMELYDGREVECVCRYSINFLSSPEFPSVDISALEVPGMRDESKGYVDLTGLRLLQVWNSELSALSNEVMYKIGAATDRTESVIIGRDFTQFSSGIENVAFLEPSYKGETFCGPGDSGAVVRRKADDSAVLMVIGEADFTKSGGGKAIMAFKMRDGLDALKGHSGSEWRLLNDTGLAVAD